MTPANEIQQEKGSIAVRLYEQYEIVPRQHTLFTFNKVQPYQWKSLITKEQSIDDR